MENKPQKHFQKTVKVTYRWWSDKRRVYTDETRQELDDQAQEQIAYWKEKGIHHGELSHEIDNIGYRGWFETTRK